MKQYYALFTSDEAFDLPKDFFIVNCGYNNAEPKDKIHYKRLRSDFYLLLLTQGQITYVANKKRYTMNAGEMFLYYPNVPQEYKISDKENTTWYWVHFAGTKATEFMEKLELCTGPIYPENTDKILKIYNKILNEYKARDIFYEEAAVNYLHELLYELARSKNQFSLKNEFNTVMEKIMLMPTISNDECAKICHCSTVHFVRLFKKNYGMTPHQYKQKIIVNQMKELLLTTNKTVGAIADILGFDSNPLYVNKLFKKLTGMTPIDYRKKARQNNKHF